MEAQITQQPEGRTTADHRGNNSLTSRTETRQTELWKNQPTVGHPAL